MRLSIDEMGRAADVAKRNLKEFDFFDEEQHKITAGVIGTFLSLEYRTSPGNPKGTTHFDLNIYDDYEKKSVILPR